MGTGYNRLMSTSSCLLYIDAFAGLSGDMFLGALADLGLEAEVFTSLPQRLGFAEVTLEIQAIQRRGIAAKQVVIHAEHEHHHRHLHHIEEILSRSGLPASVAEGALKTFRLLAQAEARVHGTVPEKIHFHEVGAADSILDITGTHLGLHQLQVERIECSPLPLSRGQTAMSHGVLPIPAPATVELLRGVPTYPIDIPFESVTPTGASLAVTLSTSFGAWPAMTVERSGYGAGTKEGGELPNLLRLVLGSTTGGLTMDHVWVLECEVDDMLPEFFEPLWTLSFERGALDLFLTPVQMKKGRPGTLITLLVSGLRRQECEQLLLEHTTTLGVRRTLCERTLLKREIVQVETGYGVIPIKVVPGLSRRAAPEASVVMAAAAQAGVPMAVVYGAAMRAWGQR